MTGWIVLAFAGLAIAADSQTSESVRRALDLIRRGDWSQANHAIDQAIEQSPDDLLALYWKSYILFQTGKYELSSAYASRYLERNPSNGDAHKILGLDSFMLGRRAQAELELRRACELSPADSEARYYLGRVQFERQDMPAALDSFQVVITLDPGSVRGHNHLGQTLEGLARFTEARAAYLKAVEIEQAQEKKSEWPYFNLGVLSLKEGQATEAVRWLKEALDRQPSWADAKVQLASALSSANRYEDASRLLEDLLATDPRNANAHYQLARLLLKMRRPEDARRHFQLFSELKQR